MFSLLRQWKARGLRTLRWLRYGDTEAVSFFDDETPERVRRNWPIMTIAKWRFFCRLLWSAFLDAYRRVLWENRVFHPDALVGQAEGDYGKFQIGITAKNAFCMIRQSEGRVTLETNGAAHGIFFCVGRHALVRDTGVLTIWAEQTEASQKIFEKRVSALHAGWDCFWWEIPEPFRLTHAPLTLRWRLDGAPQRLFISAPVIVKREPSQCCLVLLADAVRPQDIGLYGHGGETPQIDAFFTPGAWFDHAYAQSNWTLPAFASIALSQYASQHGVVDPDRFATAMPRGIPTLAEAMRERGFYTYGSVAHRRCNHSLGHHRGFDHFRYAQTVESEFRSPGRAGANHMALQIEELCEYLQHVRGHQFFGFVHFFDTHFPFLHDPLHLQRTHLTHPDPLNSYVKRSFRGQLHPEEYDYIIAQYRTKVAALDAYLADLFQLLGTMEQMTVILASDHGYSFHQPLGTQLQVEGIHTPFLMRSTQHAMPQGLQSGYVESSIDIFATLCELYGITPRGSAVQGTPVVDRRGRVTTKKLALSELIYGETYQMRVMGDGGCQLLASAARMRPQLRPHDAVPQLCETAVGMDPEALLADPSWQRWRHLPYTDVLRNHLLAASHGAQSQRHVGSGQ